MAMSPYGASTAYANPEQDALKKKTQSPQGHMNDAKPQQAMTRGGEDDGTFVPAGGKPPQQDSGVQKIQPQLTFAQMQQQGIARPAPPAPAPQPFQPQPVEVQGRVRHLPVDTDGRGGMAPPQQQSAPPQQSAPDDALQQVIASQQAQAPAAPQPMGVSMPPAPAAAPQPDAALQQVIASQGGGAPGPQAATPQAGGMDARLQAYAQSMMDTPSMYNDKQMQAQFDRMGGQIDDQYAQQNTAVREEMARRGLADSSIAGGRLADLNVGQRSAKTDLAAQIAQQAAQTYGSDRANAFSSAMGLNAQGIQQSQFGQNLAQQGSQFDRNLRNQQSQFGMNYEQQNNQFNRNMQQQGYQFDQNLANNQNQFNQNMGLQRDQFTTQNRQWDQNFSRQGDQFDRNFNQQGDQFTRSLNQNQSQFKSSMDQRGLEYLMSMLGPQFAGFGY